jgi:hypothetical protein
LKYLKTNSNITDNLKLEIKVETLKVKTKDISIEFAKAVKLKDINLIEHLLSVKGSFNIQDNELETQDANKEQFINWFGKKLDSVTIYKVAFDQCLHCMIGNKVVLFNGGKFPRVIKDVSERSKTGLMLEIEEDKIIGINFCYVFAKTENLYQFECNQKKGNR